MAFLSASCLICERILREADNALSVIRLVGLFSTRPHPQIPIEQQGVPVGALGIVSFSPDDDTKHIISATLIRPSGEETDMGLMADQPIPLGIIPELPRTVHLVMQLGVFPKEFGVHALVIKVDGTEAARSQFVLRLIPDGPILATPIAPDQAPQ